MDYDSIASRPDQDGWVPFLQDRICFSFKTIERFDAKGKGAPARHGPSNTNMSRSGYVLSEPTLDTKLEALNPLDDWHNFWRRGLAFYAAGKIIDANEVASMMNQFRFAQVTAETNAHPFLWGAKDMWDSMQIERMFRLLSINRLDSERAMTAHFMQALEFIIKAALAHCNYHYTKMFYFQDGHNLVFLYDALPDCCRCEVERAANDFFDDFEADRKTFGSFMQSFGSNDGDDVGANIRSYKGLDGLMAQRKYLDMSNEGAPHREHKLENWVRDSLCTSGNLVRHRYGRSPSPNKGPKPARDSYSTNAVYAARSVARFFLEYLFGWETITARHSTLGDAGSTS